MNGSALTDILDKRQHYRAKIRSLSKTRAAKYIDIIRILVLTDKQVIDALVATYFEYHTGVTPMEATHRVPQRFVTDFTDDDEFFFYVSDLLKKSIDIG